MWLTPSYDKYTKDKATKCSIRDVESAGIKENKVNEAFRSKVEKEKERIRPTASEEIRAEDEKEAKESEIMQIISTSTVVVFSSEDSAPPYAPFK